MFKDKWDKTQGIRERASITLEEICGLEVAQSFEGVAFTLTILCLQQAALLGFDNKETLLAWDARLRYTLGEGELIFSTGICSGFLLRYRGPLVMFWDMLSQLAFLSAEPNQQENLIITRAGVETQSKQLEGQQVKGQQVKRISLDYDYDNK